MTMRGRRLSSRLSLIDVVTRKLDVMIAKRRPIHTEQIVTKGLNRPSNTNGESHRKPTGTTTFIMRTEDHPTTKLANNTSARVLRMLADNIIGSTRPMEEALLATRRLQDSQCHRFPCSSSSS